MNSIKILHVLGNLDRGGAETMLMNFFRVLPDDLHFDFVVHGKKVGVYEQEIKSKGSLIVHMPKYKIYNTLTYILKWYFFLKNHSEYKIIHAHMISTAILFLPICHVLGRKVVVHSHNTKISGTLLKRILEFLSQFPLRYFADYYFGCSEKAIFSKFGKSIIKRKVYMIWHNAINTEKFQFSLTNREEIRSKLQISKECIVIGNVGRFVHQKNHDFLIEIMKELRKINNDFLLLLIGEGYLENSIRKKVINNKLESHVVFTGAINNVNEYLSCMDIFVMPSFYEGLPVSGIEAQCNGLNCIFADTITKEVDISGHVEYIGISKNDISRWIKCILHKANRDNLFLINGDYEVHNEVLKVKKIYEKILE